MINATEFAKGEKYTNRKGTYTVLELHPPSMTVRYDDGLEETLDIAIQQRILSNMTLPPRTPEPPPRRRTGPATPPKLAPSTRSVEIPAPASRRPARAATATLARPTRKASPAAVIPTTTFAQLAALAGKEDQKARLDGLNAALTHADAFEALANRSREAERDRLQVFTLEQVTRMHAADPVPSRQNPEEFLAYAIAQNRAYLAAEGQEILAWRFPLYEAGTERYVIDLLCYDEKGRRAMLVCTRVKTTQRHWLWEALLDSLRNWAAVTATTSFPTALGAY
ncbi:MAG TPA: hypothetical protein VKY74_17070, partial [Chloroflexia bacterium]|nr:hypothetical protein [Chloroflexia bacterium]